MARLVPPDDESAKGGLGAVKGWMGSDDPFLGAVDEIVEARGRHRPRVLPPARRRR